MSENLENYLVRALQRFEKARKEMEKVEGFCRQSESMRMLEELIKEQKPNEDTHFTARSPR